MLTIWGRTNSINVMKVLWVCAEMGLSYTRHDAGMQFGVVGSDAYGAMNPNRRVPTIVDGDFSLWESNVIVRYLAMREQRTDLLPDTPRARADAERWMDWATSTLAGPMTTLFWQLIRTPEASRDQSALEKAAADCVRCFGIVDAQLAGRAYLCGDTLTVADIAVAPFVHRWLALPIAHEDMSSLQAYYRRTMMREGYRQHVALPLS